MHVGHAEGFFKYILKGLEKETTVSHQEANHLHMDIPKQVLILHHYHPIHILILL